MLSCYFFSRGSHDKVSKSERSRTDPNSLNTKSLNIDQGLKNNATRTTGNGKAKENVENLFETSMDISFSLSSQVHSTPVESSKYAKKTATKQNEKPTLRPAHGALHSAEEEKDRNVTSTKGKVNIISEFQNVVKSLKLFNFMRIFCGHLNNISLY